MSTLSRRTLALAPSTHSENSASGRSSVELSHHTAAQTVFMDITQTFGITFVPDLFAGMENRPAYLESAWELFKEDLGLDSLDYRTKHIMALAITTNEAGVYYIAAYPHTFRLNALDHAICDKLLCTIRFFNAFDRYLSGVNPEYLLKAIRVVSDCLREEYLNSGATSQIQASPSRNDNVPVASWISGILIIISFLLLPIAAGMYLFSP